MKLMYGKTPLKSVKVGTNTDDANVIPSDLQAGVSCYARGKKVIGTGKSFEFADYGGVYTNFPLDVPSMINVIEIASTSYPIKMVIELSKMKNADFSISQNIGSVIIDTVDYPVTLDIQDNFLTLFCDKTVNLQVFYGKDNYV